MVLFSSQCLSLPYILDFWVLFWFGFVYLHWVFLGMCGLLVAVLRLSYSLAHEILVPQPRIQPTSPAREGRILSHQTTMEVSTYSFFNLLSVSPVQGLREQGPCQICSFLCSQMQEYCLAHRRHLLQLSG